MGQAYCLEFLLQRPAARPWYRDIESRVLDSIQQCLGHAADLRSYRLNGSPQRRVIALGHLLSMRTESPRVSDENQSDLLQMAVSFTPGASSTPGTTQKMAYFHAHCAMLGLFRLACS